MGATRSRLVQFASLIMLFVFLGLAVFQRAEELQSQLTYAFEGRHGDHIEVMQSYVLDNVDLEGRILILGLFDQFNEVAIRWQGAITTGRAPSEIFVDTRPQFNYGRNRILPDDAGGDISEAVVLRAAADQGNYRQIVVVQGKNSADPYVIAAQSALGDFASTSRLFEDYRIDIFDVGGWKKEASSQKSSSTHHDLAQ